MLRTKLILILVAIFAFAYPRLVLAQIVILDFQSLEQVDNITHSAGNFFQEDGFDISALDVGQQEARLAYAGTGNENFPGSTALWQGVGTGEIVLERTEGGTFNLISIDIVELPGFEQNGDFQDWGPVVVEFIGTKTNSKTVQATVIVEQAAVQGALNLQTVVFRNLKKLVSLSWFQMGGGEINEATHQFDNIVLKIHSDGGGACIPTHNKEKGPRCSDNIDNDCDGDIDGADSDCG